MRRDDFTAHPDLTGVRVLVTAGPTHEAIDPVRYIANASSGKMGYAIARAFLRAGAAVTLISGPVALDAPEGAEVVHVTSAEEMLAASEEVFARVDAAVLAAAVADYTPVRVADHKIKKSEGGLRVIELKETADILKALSAAKGPRVVVGFAAETDDLIAHATEKLTSKGCDLIVANDVSRADSTFGSDTDRVTLVFPDGPRALPLMAKGEVAEIIVAEVAGLLAERRAS